MIENFISVEKWPSHALVLPRIQAHRGYCKTGAKENTLEAFRAAKQKGALMYECDVRLSKDQIPVLFHDEDLQRLGSSPEPVADLTAKELKAKVNAPTLEEVLLDLHSPRFANIEFKTKQKIDDPLERKVAEVINRTRAHNRVLFSSFNPMSIYRISLHLPQVPRALLVSDADDPDNNFVLRKMLMAPFLKFHCLHLEASMVSDQKMEFWNRNRIPVAVWTIKEKDEIQRYLKMGVISVITDAL